MVTLKKIISFISYPTAYLDKVREQPIKTDILSFIITALTGSILFFVSSVIRMMYTGQGGVMGMAALAVMAVTIIFVFVVNALFFLLVIGLIEHVFVLFIDGHRGFEKTMKSVIYASVLPVLFFWVPAVFHVAYSALLLAGTFCIVTFYGILTFHQKTKDRAAFVAVFTTGLILALLWFGKVNIIGNAG